MRTLISSVAVAVLLALALPAVSRGQCPAGSSGPCVTRYVHPVYMTTAAGPVGPASSAPPSEPGYLPGMPMPEPTPAIPGSGPGAKSIVWLARQGVYAIGYRIAEGPHKGLWRVDPGSKVAPASSTPRSRGGAYTSPEGLSATPAQSAGATQTAPSDHRQGFLTWLNGFRAQHGLGPVGYDAALESWAFLNCVRQAQAGVSGHYCQALFHQVAFFGPTSLEQAIAGWVASPSHRAALLEPSVRMVGIGVTGGSWTANLK